MKNIDSNQRFKISELVYENYEKGFVINSNDIISNFFKNYQVHKYLHKNRGWFRVEEKFIKGEHPEYIDSVLSYEILPIFRRYFWCDDSSFGEEHRFKQIGRDWREFRTISALDLRKAQVIFRLFHCSYKMLDDLEDLIELGSIQAVQEKRERETKPFVTEVSVNVEDNKALEIERLEVEVATLRDELKAERAGRGKAESVLVDYLQNIFEGQPASDDMGRYYHELKRRRELEQGEENLAWEKRKKELEDIVGQARKEREEQERLAKDLFHQITVDHLTLKNLMSETILKLSGEIQQTKSLVNENYLKVELKLADQKGWIQDIIHQVEKNQMLLLEGVDKRFLNIEKQLGEFGVAMQRLVVDFERGKLGIDRMLQDAQILYDKFQNNVDAQKNAMDFAMKQIAMKDENLALQLSNGVLQLESVAKDALVAMKDLAYEKQGVAHLYEMKEKEIQLAEADLKRIEDQIAAANQLLEEKMSRYRMEKEYQDKVMEIKYNYRDKEFELKNAMDKLERETFKRLLERDMEAQEKEYEILRLKDQLSVVKTRLELAQIQNQQIRALTAGK